MNKNPLLLFFSLSLCSKEDTVLPEHQDQICQELKETDDFEKLCQACEQGKIEIVKELLKKNIELLNVNDINRPKPLICAAKNNQYDIVKLLLDNKIDPDIEDMYDMAALGYAVLDKNYRLAELLLEKGANPHTGVLTDCICYRTVLAEAIAFQEDLKMANLLKKFGADLNHQDKKGQTDVHHIGYSGAFYLERLLKAGLDPNIRDKWRRKSYHYLPSINQVGEEEVNKMFQLLIDYGLVVDE